MQKKCTNDLMEKVRVLVESGVSFAKIAVTVGVSERIMHAWKEEGSKHYNKKFADMATQAIEDRDTGRIKAG